MSKQSNNSKNGRRRRTVIYFDKVVHEDIEMLAKMNKSSVSHLVSEIMESVMYEGVKELVQLMREVLFTDEVKTNV